MAISLILNIVFAVVVLTAVLRLAWWGISTAHPSDGHPVKSARPVTFTLRERDRSAA